MPKRLEDENYPGLLANPNRRRKLLARRQKRHRIIHESGRGLKALWRRIVERSRQK